MTLQHTSIKTVAVALATATALTLGGAAGVADAHSLRVGETSVDSGIVDGGSNQGMHPHASTLENGPANSAQANANANERDNAWTNDAGHRNNGSAHYAEVSHRGNGSQTGSANPPLED
ncbi:hypothetical protein GCM10028792_40340 [Salinisphaera aquimarina]